MRWLVQWAAATVPWPIRGRYRDEWLYDYDHAHEAGMRRSSIVLGAWLTAARVDRLAAPSPAHARIQAAMRARLAAMHVLVPGAAGAALTATGAVHAGDPGLRLAVQLIVVALLGIGLVGVVQSVVLAAGSGGLSWASPALLGAGVLTGLPLQLGVAEWWSAAGWMLGVLLVAAGVMLLLAPHGPLPRIDGSRRARIIAPLAAGGAMLVFVALGVIDGLVWMPLAHADPPMPLDAIYRELERRGEGGGQGSILVWGAVAGGVVAAVTGTLALVRPPWRWGIALLLWLGLGLVVTQWVAAFWLGNSLGDAIPPFRGTNSVAWICWSVTGVCLTAASIVLVCAPPRLPDASAPIPGSGAPNLSVWGAKRPARPPR